MNITAKETHRLGTSVHLAFTDDDGKDIYPGGRYVPASEWDDDPEAVIARTAEYLATLPVVPTPTAPVSETPVVMTDAQVTAKLAEIAAAKEAAELAAKEAKE